VTSVIILCQLYKVAKDYYINLWRVLETEGEIVDAFFDSSTETNMI